MCVVFGVTFLVSNGFGLAPSSSSVLKNFSALTSLLGCRGSSVIKGHSVFTFRLYLPSLTVACNWFKDQTSTRQNSIEALIYGKMILRIAADWNPDELDCLTSWFDEETMFIKMLASHGRSIGAASVGKKMKIEIENSRSGKSHYCRWRKKRRRREPGRWKRRTQHWRKAHQIFCLISPPLGFRERRDLLDWYKVSYSVKFNTLQLQIFKSN